jgi:DNA-binding CsgD family transcriptional regulator
MPKEIPFDRARSAARLIGEVHELGASTESGRNHLVRGLVDLVGAAVGAVAHDDQFVMGGTQGVVAATLVNFDGATLGVFETHDRFGAYWNPYHNAVLRTLPKPGAVVAHSSAEIVRQTDWEASEFRNDHLRPAGLDHFVGSERVLGAAEAVLFGLVRSRTDGPFTQEDRDVLHLVHLGVGCVFDTCPVRATLAPRVRATLDGLLAGYADKEIAVSLGISPHTIHQYVKSIFDAYGVSSRSQLLSRHLSARGRGARNAGDRDGAWVPNRQRRRVAS